MQLEEQKRLEILIDKYNNTDSSIIKENIIKYINASPYKSQYIADAVGVDIQTIYLWRQPQKKTTVSFEYALKLCNVLGISITALMNQY